MLKPVIAATAILAIAGSSLVYAQQYGGRGFRGDGGPRMERQHRHLSADDVSALADAKIAALKAGLELTPDQAKNWPAFEAALRSMVQQRIDRIKARQAAGDQAQSNTSPFDRLAKRADAMNKRSVALKQIADAGAPLYSSLNDAQKARFTMLSRLLRPHNRQAANDGDGRGQDGRGQDGRGWGHGFRRFGQNDQGPGPDGQGGPGWHHQMHRLNDGDSHL
jgi:zinc resistance-associated protein